MRRGWVTFRNKPDPMHTTSRAKQRDHIGLYPILTPE